MIYVSYQEHFYVDSPLSSTNARHRIGVVNYSSLLPSLPSDKLPEGSECQLYGCTLSTDDTTYTKIEGEKCNISYPGDYFVINLVVFKHNGVLHVIPY